MVGGTRTGETDKFKSERTDEFLIEVVALNEETSGSHKDQSYATDRKTRNKTGFTNSRIADDHTFEETLTTRE